MSDSSGAKVKVNADPRRLMLALRNKEFDTYWYTMNQITEDPKRAQRAIHWLAVLAASWHCPDCDRYGHSKDEFADNDESDEFTEFIESQLRFALAHPDRTPADWVVNERAEILEEFAKDNSWFNPLGFIEEQEP